MTELDFYQFIHDNNIEYHWHWNDKTKQSDVIFFVPRYFINELCETLGSSIFDDEGIDCVLKDGYIAIWAADVLDYFGIDTTAIFGTDTETN